LSDLLPVSARTDEEIVAELARVTRVDSALAADKAELVTGLAAHRPDSADREIGEPGAAADGWVPGPGREPVAGVSEFFADELAVRELEPVVLQRVVAAVLPRAATVSVSRLRAIARAELLGVDATAADRRRTRAERCADVTVTPMRDGMAELRAFLPQPLAAAIRETAAVLTPTTDQRVRRSSAMNMASVPCRCGQSCP